MNSSCLALAVDPIPTTSSKTLHHISSFFIYNFFLSMGSFLSTCKLDQIFPILKRENGEPPLPIKTKLHFLFSLQISWIFLHSFILFEFLFTHQLTVLELLFFKASTYLIWQTDNCYIIFMLFDGSFVKLFAALVPAPRLFFTSLDES